MADNPPSSKPAKAEATKKAPHCGIVMPIAAMGTYDASHWVRVKEVLYDAIEEAGFTPRLVSDSDDVGVIHGQIVQNLYADEIVVCDVSGRNANVMFELGMRLAFDKPTIIVKDDATDFSFDTQVMKHILYRRDQRFDDLVRFKGEVKDAIKGTLAKKDTDPNYSPFLKHFGNFIPKSIESTEVPQAEYIMRMMEQVRTEMRELHYFIRKDEMKSEEYRMLRHHLESEADSKRARIIEEAEKIFGTVIDDAIAKDGINAKIMDIRDELKSALRSRNIFLTSNDFAKIYESVWESKFGKGAGIFE